MIFNKKDGTIRKNYKESCMLILNSKKYKRKITKYKGDEIIEIYDCFTIKFPYSFSNKKKRNCEEKIKSICDEFNYITRTWYSGGISSIDILSDNIDNLIISIKKSITDKECE